jgi:hydroxypyruvate isomerase
MPKFAANLTMLFGDVPFLDRFARAAKAGFTGVEYLFPYDYQADELAARLEEHRLTQVLHNLPAGDWARGERGIACHPDRIQEFRAGVDQAIAYATRLGCSRLNCLSGITPPGISEAQARTTFVDNLRFAAGRLRSADIKLLIEPINTRDIPGFFLRHSAQALDIIAEVGSDNLFLQYDVYHMQIMEGDLASTITRCLPSIAHMQIADPPARNEPGTGEINFTYLFDLIDRLGYSGWVGCEYKPIALTEDGLGWLRPHLTFVA